MPSKPPKWYWAIIAVLFVGSGISFLWVAIAYRYENSPQVQLSTAAVAGYAFAIVLVWFVRAMPTRKAGSTWAQTFGFGRRQYRTYSGQTTTERTRRYI